MIRQICQLKTFSGIAVIVTSVISYIWGWSFSIKDINFDWETQTGRYHDYFTSGVACSEVEVDLLTGGYHIISTDIIMDVGDSLNPALDIGQVSAAADGILSDVIL